MVVKGKNTLEKYHQGLKFSKLHFFKKYLNMNTNFILSNNSVVRHYRHNDELLKLHDWPDVVQT